MDWIFDNLQVVLFVVIVLVSLAKRILDARREAAEEEDSTIEDWTPPPPRRQPAGPPPLGRTVTPPPMPQGSKKINTRVIGRAAPVAGDGPSGLQRQQEMMERLRQAKLEKEQRAKVAAAQRSSGKSAGAPTAPGGGGLRRVLRQRADVRRAVVLREILGPPVGMR